MNAFTWAILTAFVWGIVPLFEKAGLSKTAPLTGLFYRCIGVVIGLVLLTTFMIKPQQIKSIDLRSALFLILGGFLASFIGQIGFYNSLKLGEVSRVVPISGSYPLFTFLLGVLIFGESITWVKSFGIVLIVLGIWTLKVG
ncbi:MAG: EamA family transporter [Candidatus Omnitrophota bacterium]